jgi:hypothetical protein
MDWRRLLLLALGGSLLLGQGGPPTVRYALTWEYATVAPAFVVEQCRNQGPHCSMAPVATVPGWSRRIELGGLPRNRSYCWQVRVPNGPPSNIACSP